MRARCVIVLARACVTVGVAFAIHGTITNHPTSFRAGILTLLMALAAVIELGSRARLQKLMTHQDEVARLSATERQSYAQMGWKAAELNATTGGPRGVASEAEIVELPHARHRNQMRRDGSA